MRAISFLQIPRILRLLGSAPKAIIVRSRSGYFLHLDHPPVETARSEEIVVSPKLGDPTVRENGDDIGAANCREPMGNDEGRSIIPNRR